MGQNNASIAALIGSRICHDLISPIGAINNGLELLNMSGSGTGPELDLISESVGNASARILFFRLAYGAAGNQSIGRNEIVSILQDYTRGSRLTMAYGPLDPQPRWAIRMLFLGLQCMETAMPYGGRIEAAVTDDAWSISGFADKFSVELSLWDVLRTGNLETLTPAQVQFALLHCHAKDMDRRVNFTQESPGHVRLTF